jgi:hypothetical protein
MPATLGAMSPAISISALHFLCGQYDRNGLQ